MLQNLLKSSTVKYIDSEPYLDLELIERNIDDIYNGVIISSTKPTVQRKNRQGHSNVFQGKVVPDSLVDDL